MLGWLHNTTEDKYKQGGVAPPRVACLRQGVAPPCGACLRQGGAHGGRAPQRRSLRHVI
jgi:hypothetical protein